VSNPQNDKIELYEKLLIRYGRLEARVKQELT
jgi:hypothetical protein